MMKYSHYLLSLFSASLLFIGCQKEYSVETGTGANSVTAQWQFKEAGVQFKGPVDTAYIDTVSAIKFLTIEGRSDDAKDQITLQIFAAELKPGVYKTPLSSFDYLRSGVPLYQTDQTIIDSFSITITTIDSFGVSGTFFGKTLNPAAASKTITEGKFSAKFKTNSTVITPPVTDSGQVMLWSKAGCGGGTSTTPIAVSVSSKSGQINTFYPTEPAACGAAGAFTAKLAVGNYTWKAKCGTDSITGSVSVVNGGCTKVLVDFTNPQLDYFPTTANSNWSYLFENSTPDDTAYVLSTGVPKVFGGNTYSLFTDDYGTAGKDTIYYRKAAGLYYEYYPAEANIFGFETPTAIQHTFLEDNVAAGTIWSSTYTGTVTPGIPVTGKIIDTLSQKLATYTVGTKTYQDVLEVHSGYFAIFPQPLGTQQVYVIKQWFARGVGLIKFYQDDLTASTEYVMDLTRYKVY
jgi:hypothetical protein